MATRSAQSPAVPLAGVGSRLASIIRRATGPAIPDLRFEVKRAREVRLFSIILLSIAIGMAVAGPVLGGASSLSTDPMVSLVAGAGFALAAGLLLLLIIRARSPMVLETLGVLAGVLTLVEALYGQLNNPASVDAVAAYVSIGIAVCAFALPWRPLSHYVFVGLATPMALAGLSVVPDPSERGALTGAVLFAVAVSLIGKPVAWRSRIALYERTMQSRRLNAQLQDLVRRDQTTGLATRAAFNARLVRLSQRPAGRIGFVLIDIDNFKAINDTLGHPAGDDILLRVGNAIQGAIRDGDRAYRYGGEELVVVLDRLPHHAITVAAERIRAAVEALQIANPGAGTDVTVSIGVAVVDLPANATELGTAIAAADAALYVAKGAGKNRVEAAPLAA